MAAQKAEAQRRLLRPSKKFDGDASDWQKRRLSVEKKKGELVGKSDDIVKLLCFTVRRSRINLNNFSKIMDGCDKCNNASK